MRHKRSLESFRSRAWFGALAFALLASSAGAEENAVPAAGPPALTLSEALAYAHAHQPEIRAALARIESEKARADVPRGQWLPLVGVGAQLLGATSNNTTASYLPTLDVDVPRIGGTTVVSQSTATLQPFASTFVGASVSQEIFDFGRIAAQAAAADARVLVAQHASDATRLAVDFSVEEAYLAVYAAKGVLAAADGAYERSREHRDLARAGVGSGLRSPIQLTRAEAELARFEVARIRAQSNVALAQAVLAASIGSTEPAYDVTGATPTFPEVGTLTTAIHKASERDPRIKEALARLAAQEKATTAIRAELRPNILGSATVSGRAGGAPPSGTGVGPAGEGWAPDVPNWDAALVISWPLFDGVVSARKSASRAEEQVRREEVSLARVQELADIERTYLGLEKARLALPALQRSLDGAIANYAQADARFKSGLGDQVELADADGIRADAEVQLALGVFDVARARADFGRAIAEGL
jgi:outer membrane protein